MTTKNDISVSLVLGSGGARGLAHIGVIHWLEENGYKIESISGCSMGALIGGVYAAGKLGVFENWVRAITKVDIVTLLDLSWKKSGLVKGDKIINTLSELVGDVVIEDLPIKYTAVATDLIKQKEVWIQKGDLLDAIRASIAIPTIFTPKKIANRYLIDGGILNPLPIAPTVSDDTEITIAVNLNAYNVKKYDIEIPKKELEKENRFKEIFFELKQKAQIFFEKRSKSEFDEMNMFGIVGKTIDIMQNSVLECKMAGYSPDIMINIANDACDFYEFNRAYELIELGKIVTKEKIQE